MCLIRRCLKNQHGVFFFGLEVPTNSNETWRQSDSDAGIQWGLDLGCFFIGKDPHWWPQQIHIIRKLM